MILIGDNPFHGISHLSQDRVRTRGTSVTEPVRAADLVVSSLNSGADGFMFSLDETTLEILRRASNVIKSKNAALCPIVPYAYGYARQMVQAGGMTGLLADFLKNVASSVNVSAALSASSAAIKSDPISLLKAYLLYEVSRIEAACGTRKNLYSVFLHEIVTDMTLALGSKKIFESYFKIISDLDVMPGFETRNFAYLVSKLADWGIKLPEIAIVAPFNKVGFQMSPSKEECERTLSAIPSSSNIIAMSIMASGFIGLEESISYIESLPNLKGVVLGVSSESQAAKSFPLLVQKLMKNFS